MSASIPRSRKSNKSEIPKVILETAIPSIGESETEEEINMRRITSIPIDPQNIPHGMKTPSKLQEEETARLIQLELEKLDDEKKSQKMYKLLALGAAIATGAIVAYKVSSYVSAETVVEAIVEDTK